MKTVLSESNRLLALARQATNPTVWWLIPILMLVFTIAGSVGVLLPDGTAEEIGLWRSALYTNGYLILSFLPVAFAVGIWIKRREGRPISSIGFESGNVWRKVLLGLLSGFGLLALGMGLLLAAGRAELNPGTSDARGLAALAPALFVFVGWAVQGTTEEIMFRGWLLPNTGAQLGPVPGIAFSTLVFAFAHAANPGVSTVAIVNLFLIGVLFALIALLEGGIWTVAGVHVAWNWAQSNVFGFDVSGLDVGGGSILKIAPHGSSFVTGDDFGFEGSLAATAVILLGLFIVLSIAYQTRE